MDWYVRGVDVRCIVEDVEKTCKTLGYKALLDNSWELFGFTPSEMEDVLDKLRTYSMLTDPGTKRDKLGQPIVPIGWW
ncbi:MAG: hypothetical protein NT016_03110 [Candidatus Aenigmarchaeota archaeon]|nr:hypothetical protein [Candidatus Aenigmarchaeota archaeon]